MKTTSSLISFIVSEILFAILFILLYNFFDLVYVSSMPNIGVAFFLISIFIAITVKKYKAYKAKKISKSQVMTKFWKTNLVLSAICLSIPLAFITSCINSSDPLGLCALSILILSPLLFGFLVLGSITLSVGIRGLLGNTFEKQKLIRWIVIYVMLIIALNYLLPILIPILLRATL